MSQQFEVGEIAIIREDTPVDKCPPDLGKFIGEDVEITEVFGPSAPETKAASDIVYRVRHSTGEVFCAAQRALRKKKKPYDGNEIGSADIIKKYTGWKIPTRVKAKA